VTGIILRWIAHSVAIYMVSGLLRGMRVDSVQDAILAGAVLGVINTIVRPILVVLTLPVTVLTLGLFYFVISAFCLWLTSWFLPGFDVGGPFSTFVAALLVSFISAIITSMLHGATGSRRGREG
jgi:putative membrane protein